MRRVVIVGIVIGAILVGLALWRPAAHAYNDVRYDRSAYCYDWDLGGPSFHDVPHKRCVCDGAYRGNCPFFAVCDSGQIRCDGEITGYEYVFGLGSRTVDSLEEAEAYCDTIEAEDPVRERQLRDSCLVEVEETRTAES